MEIWIDNSLAFLDVLVKKKPDGSLGHTVYRKPMHTDLYYTRNQNTIRHRKMGFCKLWCTGQR
jgi:hypothetical protein